MIFFLMLLCVLKLTLTEILSKLKDGGDPPFRPHLSCNDHTQELRQLIAQCWSERPEDRPTAKVLLASLRKLDK